MTPPLQSDFFSAENGAERLIPAKHRTSSKPEAGRRGHDPALRTSNQQLDKLKFENLQTGYEFCCFYAIMGKIGHCGLC